MIPEPPGPNAPPPAARSSEPAPSELRQRERARASLVDHGQNWLSRPNRDPATPDLAVRSGVTVHVGWLHTENNRDLDSGIAWQLDAVLVDRPARATDPPAWRDRAENGRMTAPGLLLRPCLTTPLDAVRLRDAYHAWLRGLIATRSWEMWSPRDHLADLAAIRRAVPPRFPSRVPDPLALDDSGYARNATDLLAAASALVDTSADDDWGDALAAYPFARELRVDRTRSSASLVPGDAPRTAALDALPRRRRARRPRSVTLPGLDGDLQRALGDGRTLGRPRALAPATIDAVVDRWGPLPARFAVELGLGRDLSDPDEAVLAVRARYGANNGPLGPTKAVRQQIEGLKRETNKRRRRLQGRDGTDREPILRRTVPYLVADTRLCARPLADRWLLRSAGPGDLGGLAPSAFEAVLISNVELLLEWLRSPSFLETLDVVCGGDRDAVRSCVTPGPSVSALQREVRSPFHFARVVDDGGDRWIAGFGSSLPDVLSRVSCAPSASACLSWPALV